MKTILKRQIPILILLFCCLNSFAQIGPIVNTIIPPSPTSAAFRQFAGYTPSLATGTVNVPINLYDIRVGDFSVPISLQYYTQGIKFTDDPFPVGYGWMLTPGLRITRTIMDRPDMEFPMEIRNTNIDFDYCKKAMYDETSNKHAGWTNDKLLDTQHDIFTVHLPHGDYTFLLDEVNGVYKALTTNNHLKITPQGLTGFEVIDENGVIYYFGEANSTAALPFVESYHNYLTSWMLRKIVLPGSAREINFTWEKVRHSALRFGPYFGGDIVKDYKQQWNAYVPEDMNPEYESAESLGLLSQYGVYNEVLHLKQISFPGGKMDFTHKSTLKPLLTEIKVTNMNSATVKTISFDYGNGLDERLLKAVKFSDEGTYHFAYHAKRFDAGNQNSQDYWGYFNGKNNNSLVPQMQVKTYNNRMSGGYSSYVNYGTADRSVDPESMKAYMLTMVTYPTGGYTAFEYEPHQFQGSIPQTSGLAPASKIRLTQGGGLRVTKVTTVAGNGAPEVVKTYKYGTGEDGKAKVIYEPTLDTFIDELAGYGGDIVSMGSIISYNLRTLFLNTQSNYMRYTINTPALWYNVVTEYTGGEAKTVYNYQRYVQENTVSALCTMKDFPYNSVTKYNNLFSKGCLLEKKTHYRKSGSTYSPARQTTYTYSVKEDNSTVINDLVINRMGVSLLQNGPDLEYSGNRIVCGQYTIMGYSPEVTYLHNPCGIRFFYEQLDGEETIHYTSTGNVIEQTAYTYSSNHLSSKTMTNSNGQVRTERYSYPKDYAQAGTPAQQSILSAMLAKNIKAPVYKVTRTINGKSEQEWNEFKDFGNNLYLPEKSFYKKESQRDVCKAIYGYDIKGNLQSYAENGEIKHTYLWGYGNTCLVAAIAGLDYAGTLALVGQSDINDLNGNNWGISPALNSIRSKINDKGLMTSYLHEPLIGISMITTPNKSDTYYKYDRANRLQQTKDHHSKTLQYFAYHFKDEVLKVSFSANTSYVYGANLATTATATGGSDMYSYMWTLKNSAGTVIHTSAASESGAVTIPLKQSGTMTLTCTLTDKMTGESTDSNHSFTVKEATIGFTNISKSTGTVSADIDCPGDCTVDFYMMAQMFADGYARFYMDGNIYNLYGADGNNVTLNLSAGIHRFNISLVASESGNSAGLYINGIAPPYGTGKISEIQAND